MTAQPTSTKAPAASGKPPAALAVSVIPEGFTEVGTDRFMWNPNKGCDVPLQGYLLNVLEMPVIQRGKDNTQEWKTFLILTTKPTKAIDREKNVVDVPVGSEVLAPATFKLSDTFSKAAVHDVSCFEVFIKANKKIDIGSGQTMWLYSMAVNKNTIKARKDFGLAALLGPTAPPVLPAGAETAGADGEAIPF